jgi:hypothetical protein
MEQNIPLKFQKGLQKGPKGYRLWLMLAHVYLMLFFNIVFVVT